MKIINHIIMILLLFMPLQIPLEEIVLWIKSKKADFQLIIQQ